MTRAAVLFTGAIALALVARAASTYRASDPVAFGLVVLIGLGLTLGILELLVRSTRATRLYREVLALPSPATTDAIERSSPPLAALLKARIAGGHGFTIAAPFTPYLLGLLVMIGLLGTFLGLFETLRGAREALTASGDVTALRSGLAAPMTGLSRAFGTSAAGVSASAMLGLGAVFVRRAEARFLNAVNRYATGPLAPLSVASRTLAALEAIAARSEALPEAVRALSEAKAGLSALQEKMLAGQIESAAAAAAEIRGAAGAMREAAAEIRGDLRAGIEGAAMAVQAATAPLLEQATARAAAVAREELGKITSQLEARLVVEATRDTRLDALVTRLDATVEQIGAASSAHTATVQDFAAAAAARALEGEARAEARGAALTERAERVLHAQAERLVTFTQRLERDRESSAAQLVAFTQHLESDHRADAEQLVAITQRLERDRESSAAQLVAFTQRLERDREAGAAALAERLSAHARGIGESLDATGAMVREASDVLRAGGAEMAAVAEVFTLAVDRYREASDRWLKNLGAIEDAIAHREGGDGVDLVGAYLDQTREVFDHALQFQRELFSELRALRSGGRG